MYGGGGGGGTSSGTAGNGGTGNGGAGGGPTSADADFPTAATANRGGGGSGQRTGNSPSDPRSAGADGVIIVRYDTSDASDAGLTITGGSVATTGGFTYHTFNSSSSLNVEGTTGSEIAVTILAVGGGGGGGSGAGGGGEVTEVSDRVLSI